MAAPEEADEDVCDLIGDIMRRGRYIHTSGYGLAGLLLPEKVTAIPIAVPNCGMHPIAAQCGSYVGTAGSLGCEPAVAIAAYGPIGR